MATHTLIVYVAAWLPMVGIAIANGAARDLTYGKRIGELRAHQVSCATAVVLLTTYIWAIWERLHVTTVGEAIRLGLLWLGLTVLFEVVFGRLVAKATWKRLVHDYDIAAGRLWILVLLAIAAGPPLIFLLRSHTIEPFWPH